MYAGQTGRSHPTRFVEHKHAIWHSTDMLSYAKLILNTRHTHGKKNNAIRITQETLNNTHTNHLKRVALSAQEKGENKSTKTIHSRLLIVQYH